MKKLLEFIIEGILGNTDFDIEESTNEGRKEITVKANQEDIGLLIGKGGSTIKAIRNLLRVKSTLENTHFFLNVTEKTQ